MEVNYILQAIHVHGIKPDYIHTYYIALGFNLGIFSKIHINIFLHNLLVSLQVIYSWMRRDNV